MITGQTDARVRAAITIFMTLAIGSLRGWQGLDGGVPTTTS